MAGRETRIPKGSVSHRRSGIHRVFSHIAHKRRNVRFKRLWWVNTPPQPLNAHTAAHRAKHGAFQVGVVSLPSACAVWSGTSARAAVRRAYFAIFAWTEGTSERSREPSERRRARCASPFRGAAASPALSLPVLVLHRRASEGCNRCDEGQRGKFVNVTVVILFVV